jgi:hypothetical protein
MKNPAPGRHDLMHVINDFMEIFPFDRYVEGVKAKPGFTADLATEIVLANFAEFMSSYECITMCEQVDYDFIEDKVLLSIPPVDGGLRDLVEVKKK